MRETGRKIHFFMIKLQQNIGQNLGGKIQQNANKVISLYISVC